MVRTDKRGQTPPVSPSQPTSGPRILVLYSDIGEGHVSAAHTLRDEIQAEDPSAEVLLENGFEALGPFLRWFMRDFYRRQHASVPWLYRLSYEMFRRVRMFRALGALILMVLGGRGERRLVESYCPDIVISTDARLNAVLGYLKRLGRLHMPVFATLTDLGGLEFWTHRGVDLHLVMDSTCVAPVERLAGRGAACQVRPLVAPAFFYPLAQDGARVSLGLPADGKIVLVSGGGWGIGDMEGAVRAVLAVSGAHAVCVAGRNAQTHAALLAEFLGESRVTILGFTSQMNELLAACDVVVHAMGGVTYLEATVRGRPVVAYKPPAGHPALIAETLQKQGRQKVAWTQAQLTAELRDAFVRSPATPVPAAQLPSPASAIREASRRVRPRPWWQTAALRLSLAAVILVLVGTFTFFADASYPVVAKTLRLQAAKAATQPATVQLVIRARPEAVPGVLAELQAYHATASFALLSGWSSYQVQAVTAAQDQVLADLAQGSRLGWVHTRRTLQREAAGAGMATTPVYLPPRDGLTLAGYLLARSAGAVPLGHVTWVRSTRTLRDSFQAGSVVVLDLDSSAAVAPLLDGLLERLKQEGLVAVPLALEASSGGARSSGD